MKKTNLLFILLLGISTSVSAQDLKRFNYEAKEVMTFKRAGSDYKLTNKITDINVSVDQMTSKGLKNLYTKFITTKAKEGSQTIEIRPRNTIRYIDQNEDILSSVKGTISKDFRGNVTYLELNSKKMNYIHDRAVIRNANAHLNKHVRMSGILEHDLERSAFICERKSLTEITCTQEYYYYITETGRGSDLGRIK